jgi:ribosomal protein S18 acetylase RimI-like enzyme
MRNQLSAICHLLSAMSLPALFRPLDFHHVADLWQSFWPERPITEAHSFVSDVLRRQRGGHAWAYVAYAGGKLVGFGQLVRWGKRGEIADLIIHPEWREQGIGTALITRLIDIAHEQNFREIEIGVAETNTRALTLYLRLGFAEKRRLLLDVGRGLENVIYLALRLPDRSAL